MFRELMPVLEGRTLMLTLSRVDDVTIRVCVIPKRVKEDAGENALCTPLTVTGTVDELDRDFAAQLNSYTSAVVKLGSNLAEIEATHRAAMKAIEEENKKDLDRKRGKATPSKPAAEPESKPGPVIKDGKPVFGTKDASTASPAPTLFDAAPVATAMTENSEVQGVGPASGDAQNPALSLGDHAVAGI
jgi:PRTRC genetic system protein E